MSPNIDFIYFDLGDTLVQIRPDLQTDSVKRIAEARGETLKSKRHVAQAIIEYKAASDAEWAVRSDDILTVRTKADEQEYWPGYFAAILKRLGITSPDKNLIDLLATRQADSESFECVRGAGETLRRLTHAEIGLGIISNSFPSAEKILEDLKLSPWFTKHLVLSHQLLCSKPSPEIYEHAVKLAGRPAEQIMFVDDRPKFLRGADEAHLYPVLYDPTGQYRHEWTGPTIKQLATLTKLVGIEPDRTRHDKRHLAQPYPPTTVEPLRDVFHSARAAIQSIYTRMTPTR